MMKEVVDRRSGAILFKKDEDSKSIEKLEKKVKSLEQKVERLENIINSIKKDS